VAGSCSATGASSTTTMTTESTYTTAGWNFTTTWSFFNQGGYPCLRWQDNCGEQNCAPTDTTCNGQDDARCPSNAQHASTTPLDSFAT
jgi:hypothetical protein